MLLGKRQSARAAPALEPIDRARAWNPNTNPDRLFNGYEEFVQHLYDGIAGERLFT
jgi:hypothetical protein